MLKDDEGYLMAVLPATHKVDLGAVRQQLNRKLGLATDRELADLFQDCEPGALPPLGRAYGIKTLLDESLIDSPDIYFEAGDHVALVHVSGEDLLRLMANARRGEISNYVIS
jgi:Ala-tRNA(Pro) deacylase